MKRVFFILTIICGITSISCAQSSVYKQAYKYLCMEFPGDDLFVSKHVYNGIADDLLFLVNLEDSMVTKSMEDFDKDSVQNIIIPNLSKKNKNYSAVVYFSKFSNNILMASVCSNIHEEQRKCVDFHTVNMDFFDMRFWGLKYEYLFYFKENKIVKCYKTILWR